MCGSSARHTSRDLLQTNRYILRSMRSRKRKIEWKKGAESILDGAHAFDAGTWGEWGAKVTVASQIRYARAVLSLHGDRHKNQHRRSRDSLKSEKQ
jgi:hypothetical protein